MKKIRIGILGCASIAKRSIIPAILNLKNEFELVAIASRDINKANSFAKIFGCEALGSYEELVRREDIDAVYIPLPAGLHKEWILKTLDSGKHVYAEKSIAMNFEDASLIVSKAKEKDLLLMEGYMFLYHTQHLKTFEILKSGIIGEIRHFSASFGFPPLDENDFRYDKDLGGGALLDAAGYTVRAASFILQDNRLQVKSSFLKRNQKETSVYGSAFLVSEKEISISLAFGFDNYYQCKYEIWGSKGKLTGYKAFTPKLDEFPIIQVETSQGTIKHECTPDNHFEKALSEFANSIHSKGYESHYAEILEQSRLLNDIDLMSNN